MEVIWTPLFLWMTLNSISLGSGLTTPVGGVTRPNYGVDFNFLFAVNNMHGSWKHIWTLDLSLLDRKFSMDYNIRCETIDPMCQPARDFFKHIIPQLSNATSWIQQQFSWAHNPSILATMNRGTQGKKKRALLPFVGDIEKFFFGTATESDINNLKETLDDMTTLHQKTVDQVSQIGDNLASLTKITNDQIANTEAGFNLVKATFQNMTTQVNARFHELAQDLAGQSATTKYNSLAVAHTWATLGELIPRMIDVNHLLLADIQLLAGLQTILQGFIPISLIPPEDLIKGLSVALEGINREFPSARLSYPPTSLGYYYTHKVVTPRIDGNTISLIVDIPVDLGQELLYVYAIRTFPVAILPYNPYTRSVDPLSKAAQAVSELMIREDYFIIAADGESWSAASHAEISSCIGESIRVCKHQFALYKFRNQQCLERIWNNVEFTSILEVCPYRLSAPGSSHSTSVHTQVIPLANGRWYIESPLNEQWTIQCPSRPPEKRAACTSCVIQVDCGCGVESLYFRIPTRVSSCDSVFSPLRRNFSVNPFNYSPSNQPWVVNLTGDDSFPSPPRMSPDIKLPDNGAWDDVMESMDDRRFDLNKLYEKQKNETKMFMTEADALLQKIRNQDKLLASLSGWPDWILGLVVFLTFVNSGVLGLLCFCLISRVRARSIAEELDIVEKTEEIILGVELIQFLLVVCCFIMLVMLSWPILGNWIRSNKLYRRFRGQAIRIKANGYRSLRFHTDIKLQAQFCFISDAQQIERKITGLCTLGSVIQGTHLSPSNKSLIGLATLMGPNYEVVLDPPPVLILPTEHTKQCHTFDLPMDYLHRKFRVPLSSRLVRLESCQLWIDA